LEHWLDLSTGINPHSWPVPPIPAAVWRRLPEVNDGLEQAAATYYETHAVLAVAGSQAAIQGLPMLREPSRVGILHPGYAEHAHAWRRHGHRVVLLQQDTIAAAVDRLDVVVVIHPNNPTGAVFELDVLLEWRDKLAQRGGWLIVDEAFMDTTPQHSLAFAAESPGLVILRSLGKFFGLAGVRVGFVLAASTLRQRLQEHLGPWTVNGPGRWIATQALLDQTWQQTMGKTLQRDSIRLAALLDSHRLPVAGGTALFQWVQHDDAAYWHDALARQGILVRQFSDPPSLRFGLPDTEAAWQRLQQALVNSQT
jgi:cobalamin biosynthetic protein CobC